MQKARNWLEGQGHNYTFHDYKKEGSDAGKVAGWNDAKEVATVLTKRGTTYRKLSDEEKLQADDLEGEGGLLVGFKAD